MLNYIDFTSIRFRLLSSSLKIGGKKIPAKPPIKANCFLDTDLMPAEQFQTLQ